MAFLRRLQNEQADPLLVGARVAVHSCPPVWIPLEEAALLEIAHAE
jgi:hypothetical protein